MKTKQWLFLLPVLVLALLLVPVRAQAAYSSTPVHPAPTDDTLTTGPFLAEGDHEDWVDRIADLPDYAREFYNWLLENATATGALGDPAEGAAYELTLQGTVDFTFNYPDNTDFNNQARAAISDLLPVARETAMAYIVDTFHAFDMDHPEVFWLHGGIRYACGSSYDYHGYSNGKGVVEYEVYVTFYLRDDTYDIREESYRDPAILQAAIDLREERIAAILADCPQGSAYDQICYLNQVLTQTNAYNSDHTSASASKTAWESLSALKGSSGLEGPVCEGYSRAFKVLCDRLGIPCTLISGDAGTDPEGNFGAHMWNYVYLCGKWYAVDVTWNDPIVEGVEGVVSGYERADWLLLGGDTQVGTDCTFLQTHVLTNDSYKVASREPVCYTNGPELATQAYTGHNYQAAVTAPTCSAKGYTTYTCPCGDSYTGDEVATVEHSYENGVCVNCGAQCAHSWDGNDCLLCGKTCVHSWRFGKCERCGASCGHDQWENEHCAICRKACAHVRWKSGVCQQCGYTCEHLYGDGSDYCLYCGKSHVHEMVNGICTICQAECDHYYENDVCYYCQKVYCYHEMDSYMFENGICWYCGQECEHDWDCGMCLLCNMICEHTWIDGSCLVCETVCDHSYSNGVCALCGKGENDSPMACLMGDFNNWTLENNMVPVTEEILAITVPVPFVLDYRYSLFYDGSWYSSSSDLYPSMSNTLKAGRGEFAVRYTMPGNHVLYFNTQDKSMRICYVPDHMYVRGSFNDWGESILMQGDGEGNFELTMEMEAGDYYVAVTDEQNYYNALGIALTIRERSMVTYTTSIYSYCYLNYSLNIHQEPIVEPVTPPELGLKYPAVSFEDVIVMDVFFSAENLQDVVEMGLITYTENVTEYNVDNAEYVIPGYTWSESDGLYYACTQGIAPHNLADTYYFAVYAELRDGSYTYSKLVFYSPLTYAANLMNGTSTSTEMKTLAASMLNYGAAAQVYFGVEGELMNAGLTAEQAALVAPYSDSMIQDPGTADSGKVGVFANNGGFSRRYPNITLEGAFSINYFFTPAYTPAGDVTLYYWNEADYAAADVLTPENASGALVMTGEGELAAAVTGIAAKDLDSTIYVAGLYTDAEGNAWASGVLSYSIGAYCKNQASSATGSMQALAQATAVYAYYAKQLFN